MISLSSVVQTGLSWLNSFRQQPEPPARSYYLHTAMIEKRSLVNKDCYEVSLPKTNKVLLTLRPALGEPRKHPQVFEGVAMNAETLVSEVVSLRYGQPLVVKVLEQ